MLRLVITTPAAPGLLFYAFNVRLLPAAGWRALAYIFGAYSIYILALAIPAVLSKAVGSVDGALAASGAVAIMAALQFYTWLALKLYSAGLPQATAR